MLDLGSLRAELADIAATGGGWNVYTAAPGTMVLPAIVVDLPDTVEPNASHGIARLAIPVYVVAGNVHDAAAEAALMERALAVHAAYTAHQAGITFLAVRADAIVFEPMTLADGTVALAARIPLTVHAHQ